MDDIRTIMLSIADLDYPFKVKLGGKQEEFTREAVKQINDKLNAYRSAYPNLPKERYLAMIAFDFCYRNLELGEMNDTVPFMERVKVLTEELEDYFRKE